MGNSGVVDGHHVAREAGGQAVPGGAAHVDADGAPVLHVRLAPAGAAHGGLGHPLVEAEGAGGGVGPPVELPLHPVVDVHLQGGGADSGGHPACVHPLGAAELGPRALAPGAGDGEQHDALGGALGGVGEGARCGGGAGEGGQGEVGRLRVHPDGGACGGAAGARPGRRRRCRRPRGSPARRSSPRGGRPGRRAGGRRYAGEGGSGHPLGASLRPATTCGAPGSVGASAAKKPR